MYIRAHRPHTRKNNANYLVYSNMSYTTPVTIHHRGFEVLILMTTLHSSQHQTASNGCMLLITGDPSLRSLLCVSLITGNPSLGLSLYVLLIAARPHDYAFLMTVCLYNCTSIIPLVTTRPHNCVSWQPPWLGWRKRWCTGSRSRGAPVS